jgi:hypothetical protein
LLQYKKNKISIVVYTTTHAHTDCLWVRRRGVSVVWGSRHPTSKVTKTFFCLFVCFAFFGSTFSRSRNTESVKTFIDIITLYVNDAVCNPFSIVFIFALFEVKEKNPKNLSRKLTRKIFLGLHYVCVYLIDPITANDKIKFQLSLHFKRQSSQHSYILHDFVDSAVLFLSTVYFVSPFLFGLTALSGSKEES